MVLLLFSFLLVAQEISQEPTGIESFANHHELSVVNVRYQRLRHVSHEYITYRGGLLAMLFSPRIQQELSLSHSKCQRIREYRKEKKRRRSKYLLRFEWHIRGTPVGQLKSAGEFLSKLNHEFDKKALNELNDKQAKRLKELFVWELNWRHGITAILLNDHMKVSLKLEQKQRDAILNQAKEFKRKTLAELRALHVFIREEFENELNPATRKRVTEVLGENEFKKGWKLESAETLAHHNAWRLRAREMEALGLAPMKCTMRVPYSPICEISIVQKNNRVEVMLDRGFQEQLEFTKEQKAMLRKLQKSFTTEQKRLHREFYSIEKKAREPHEQKFYNDVKTLIEKYNERVETELFLPHQLRLYQNVFYTNQLRNIGFARLLLDSSNGNDFPEKIKLTDEERKRIRRKQPKVVKKVIAKRNEIQQEYMQAVHKCLGKEGKRKLEKLMGSNPKIEPFPDLITFLRQIDYAIQLESESRNEQPIPK